jgi:HEAT repeat protein
MDSRASRRRVEALLDALEDLESPGSELGTPVLAQSSELDEIVALGPAAVPQLLSLLQDQTAKVAAYLVLALNRIGDRRALEDLRRLRSHYQALDSQGEWEYAVIGQCNLAIRALEHRAE